MTSTETAHRNVGGRPLGDQERRKRLRESYIASIGAHKITPQISELISAAVDLVSLAARARRFLDGKELTRDRLMAITRLEGAAARAVARLPIPTRISTIADVAA